MWKNIDFGTVALFVLFFVPMLKDRMRVFINKRSKSWTRRSIIILRCIYWTVLLIPLVIGFVDNRNKAREREREANKAQGIKYADDGRSNLHEGLKSHSTGRIELGIKPLKQAINILQDFPTEYNKEIQARHDLALTFERLSYGTYKHACTYHIENGSIVAKSVEEGTSLSADPLFKEFRCTDFDFSHAGKWYQAEKQYHALYEQLLKRPDSVGKEVETANEMPAAARSTGYFFMCDNLRTGGQSLEIAQYAFRLVRDITDPEHLDLPDRHQNALGALEILDILDNVREVNKAGWAPECMAQGTAVELSQDVKASMANSSGHPNIQCADLNTLRLLRIPYWGFDSKAHQGEMIVSKEVTDDVLKVFRQLNTQQFPIEKMVTIDKYKGDDNASMAANNTSAFNCRPATGGDSLSAHAEGIAIDINPKQNPYVKGGAVLPAEGNDYLDRSRLRPGMVEHGSVKSLFESIGWKWGGDWESLKDYQHFSKTGK